LNAGYKHDSDVSINVEDWEGYDHGSLHDAINWGNHENTVTNPESP